MLSEYGNNLFSRFLTTILRCSYVKGLSWFGGEALIVNGEDELTGKTRKEKKQ